MLVVSQFQTERSAQEGRIKVLLTMLSLKPSLRGWGVFERFKQHIKNPKQRALIWDSQSDKGGFEIMNRVIADVWKGVAYPFQYFSGDVLDRIKVCGYS